jgi:hypothetical protein
MVNNGTILSPVMGIDLTDAIASVCVYCMTSTSESSLEQNFWRSINV